MDFEKASILIHAKYGLSFNLQAISVMGQDVLEVEPTGYNIHALKETHMT